MIEPDLVYSVLCDQARREDNGKLMLIGLFEQIGSPTFPMLHPGFCIVNKWGNGEGSFNQQIRIVDQDDNVLASDLPVPFELSGLEMCFTAVGFYHNITFLGPGRAFVEIYVNDDLKLRYGVGINEVQPTQPH